MLNKEKTNVWFILCSPLVDNRLLFVLLNNLPQHLKQLWIQNSLSKKKNIFHDSCRDSMITLANVEQIIEYVGFLYNLCKEQNSNQILMLNMQYVGFLRHFFVRSFTENNISLSVILHGSLSLFSTRGYICI